MKNPVNSNGKNVRIWCVFVPHSPFRAPNEFRSGEHLVVLCSDDSMTHDAIKRFVMDRLPPLPATHRGVLEMHPVSADELNLELPSFNVNEPPIRFTPVARDPRNAAFHPVHCASLELRFQLRDFQQEANAAWPPSPAPPIGPLPAMSRSAAHIFAQELGRDATRENAIELLKQDLVGAASFLVVATELLRNERHQTTIEFGMQTLQEKMELGHLCAFVNSRLLNLLHTNPESYNRAIDRAGR
jgi:hypothetical protein